MGGGDADLVDLLVPHDLQDREPADPLVLAIVLSGGVLHPGVAGKRLLYCY